MDKQYNTSAVPIEWHCCRDATLDRCTEGRQLGCKVLFTLLQMQQQACRNLQLAGVDNGFREREGIRLGDFCWLGATEVRMLCLQPIVACFAENQMCV